MKLCRTMMLFLLLFCVSPALAQEDRTCSAAVQEAVNAVQDFCSPTARNQACYGNVMLEATPRDDVTNFTFAQQGDIVNVVDLDTLRLSSLNLEDNVWGIALMQLQANLSATLPGQNVTFLLFGNVEIENDVPAAPELTTTEIVTNSNINVRSGPSTNVDVIASLAQGESTIANGRNEDSTWLRIQVPDGDNLGWVFTELVSPVDDVGTLGVVDASDTVLPFQPMQAFRFSSGFGEPTCEGAPQDGILIQTPQGAGKILLRANNVDVELASTGYLQAQAGEQMTVSIIDGEGTVTAEGVSVVVPAGAQVVIPMDEDLNPTDPPGDPVPYEESLVAPLPVQALPQTITIAPPISQEELDNAATGSEGGFSGGLPGMGSDFSAFEGADLGYFCSIMDQSLGQAGMTRAQYVEMINQIMGFVPASDRPAMEEFIGLLNSCP